MMNRDDAPIIAYVLHKHGLESGGVQQFSSGIANRSYAVGDDYVLKIEGKWKGVLAHQKKISDLLVKAKAKVPKILESGSFEGTPYLLMEKVSGTNLVYDWLKFDVQEKEHFIAQIADELKKFHSIRFDDYAIRIASTQLAGSGVHVKNLKDAIARVTDFGTIAMEKLSPDLRKEIQLLASFYQMHLPSLNESGTAVLVHNDLHFENIFHEGTELTGIIDFDWVCQAPNDYELWKIVEVFRRPHFTVQEHLEPVYENYRMTDELRFLKKHYPALFAHPNLTERIRLYYLEKIIDRIVSYQSGMRDERALKIAHEEIEDLYKGDWLDRMLA